MVQHLPSTIKKLYSISSTRASAHTHTEPKPKTLSNKTRKEDETIEINLVTETVKLELAPYKMNNARFLK